MIYFDSSATSLLKPATVAEAVSYAIGHFGNAGRSFYDAVMEANREIFYTRMEIAELIGLSDPLQVAYTSSATESLNLIIGSLIQPQDAVITTVTEHNSVLRPLYLKGCQLSFLPCDAAGKLKVDEFEGLVQGSTKFLVCSHGSNVTGNITDTDSLRQLCRKHNITMILDISQTFGSCPVDISMADVFCFTGHKGLLGPQGVGGIIVNGDLDFNIVKTGGAGSKSFDRFQEAKMPDVFEAGTLNAPGIYGLQKGVQFIKSVGLEAIAARENHLARLFYEGIKELPGLTIVGDWQAADRLPLVSLKFDGLDSSDLAALLWQDYRIATRAGSHCAPLLHRHFGTVRTGLVRFSFSYFNTEAEIERGIEALHTISKG